MKGAPITISNIARLLGLSKSTVSRALRDHPDISAETTEKVKKVARDLHYRPNIVASSLRQKKSSLIGVIVPQISCFFFPLILQGIENITRQKSYNLLILHSNESYEREVECLDILLANNVEGILASVSRTTGNFDHFKRVADMKLPMVFYDRVVPGLNADTVMIDDIAASCSAVHHLISSGRSRIAICTGNMNLLISRNRLNGYRKALKEAGLPVNENRIMSCEWPEEAEAAIYRLFSSQDPPDAVFTINDLTTSGVMRAMYRMKKKIPEEVAIIGFSEEPFRSLYCPALTAVEPKGFDIGKVAAEILMDRIENKADEHFTPYDIKLQADLIVKNST